MFRRRVQPPKTRRPQPAADPSLAAEASQILTEIQRKFPLKKPAILEWRRYRVTAGMAHYQAGLITLSVHVLKDSDQLRDTLLHEYAHLLAFDRHGRNGVGHGVAWRRAMNDLGQPAKVYHKYEVTRNSPRFRHVYACAKCGEKIERHRRLAAKRQYFHRTCGGAIKFVETQTVMDVDKSA